MAGPSPDDGGLPLSAGQRGAMKHGESTVSVTCQGAHPTPDGAAVVFDLEMFTAENGPNDSPGFKLRGKMIANFKRLTENKIMWRQSTKAAGMSDLGHAVFDEFCHAVTEVS